MIKILLSCAALSLISCDAPPRRFGFSDGTATVKGRIDAEMVSFFKGIKQPIKNVVITSPGGSTSAALEIVNTLGPGDYALHVQDYCLSACASIVFVGARERTLAPGSLIAFHSSDYGSMALYEVSRKHGDHSLNPDRRTIRNAARQQELYEKMGVDVRLLTLMSLKRDNVCFTDPDGGGPSDRFALVSENSGYIPSKGTLEAFGIRDMQGGVLDAPMKMISATARTAAALQRPFNLATDPPGRNMTPEEVTTLLQNYVLRQCDDVTLDKLGLSS